MTYLLGIDNGLTVSKAVLFDTEGSVVAVARRRIPQLMPLPRWVERDMDTVWQATAEAIAEITAQVDPARIACVGATAHGDGLYLLDASHHPVRAGILSLDSRAGGIAAEWEADGAAKRALERSGQVPHASAPSALLAWLKVHEPENYAKIETVLAAKDWLRFCLTGTVGTDLTEASTSFTDVGTQAYADDILPIFGLEELAHALPDVALPDEIVGHVTAEAAAMTGLHQGTPVIAGLHDVTASALGAGGYGIGKVAIVAGTYSINETVSDAPQTDPRWFCRNGIRAGEWNNMSISPASSANYEWMLDTLLSEARDQQGDGLHIRLSGEIDATRDTPLPVLFHPYLFGSPHGPTASAGFTGLRGWHTRSDMVRALVEGVAFNHRHHIDGLRDCFAVKQAFLTGGISRNPVFSSIFADALNLPVAVPKIDEAAAWGVALCAGASLGLWTRPEDGPKAPHTDHFDPHPDRAAALDKMYRLHEDTARALAPIWAQLDALTP